MTAATSWPRRDVADHHEERCAGCGVELGPGEVVRLKCGVGYHERCWWPGPRPPSWQALNLWLRCRRLTDVLTAEDEAALRYLLCRKVASGAFEHDLARLIPSELPAALHPPWAFYGQTCWAQAGYRIVVPVWDEAGRMRALRGWRWDGGEPKRVSPMGEGISQGLVMANQRGLELLRGELPPANIPIRRTAWFFGLALGLADVPHDPPKPERHTKHTPVAIVEGEPDFLTYAGKHPGWAVLGIYSGSWSGEIAARVPSGCEVYVRTHHDAAGSKYLQAVASSLGARCDAIDARG